MDMTDDVSTDVLVIGAGISGCIAALRAAENGCRVVVLSRHDGATDSSTIRAQGGIVFRGKNDTQRAMADDILRAGDGMCSEEAVRTLVKEGPARVEDLLIDQLQVPFDRTARGALHLTREGGHGCERIIHCADHTGKDIHAALWRAITAHAHITVMPGTAALDLLITTHHSTRPADVYRPPRCVGAYVLQMSPHRIFTLYARETILATGGLSRVFLYSTNPESRGDGYALAYRAGVQLINMEYVQFHPTSLYVTGAENFLITEAMRGEGGILRDGQGRAFAKDYHPSGTLAPRDVVSRAIHDTMLKTHAPCVYLDMTHMTADMLRTRFPTIYTTCATYGIDIAATPIPVVPAAHYACGGVRVDATGATNIPGVRAVGEVSCTGVHGANRLASTSLLEGVVWGARCGEECARVIAEERASALPPMASWHEESSPVDEALLGQDWMIIQHTMWNYVGLVRGNRRLRRAQRILRELQTEVELFYRHAAITDSVIGVRNGLHAARSILHAAVRNHQSRGCHYRVEDDTIVTSDGIAPSAKDMNKRVTLTGF